MTLFPRTTSTLSSALSKRMPARFRDYVVGLSLGAMTSYAHASILAPKVCQVFRNVAGNDLYSIACGVGGVGLLIANAMDEGDNKLKTSALRIGLAGAGLVNLETISSYVTGSPWGC